MNRAARLVTVLAVAAALLSTAGCKKLQARDELNKGIKSYKNANYEQAINHFQEAVRLDGELKVAKLYLATAYAQQYVPGVLSKENMDNANQAIAEYNNVLSNDPQNINSIKGIGYLYMNMKKWDDARQFYKKALELDPNDPDLYYSVGFIDWSQAYQDAAQIKADAGMRVEDELKGKANQKYCDQIKAKDGAAVEEGMKMLQTAINKREDYDSAMAYLNLLYRRKANDMTCEDAEARAGYIKAANDWINKAMDARKKKAEAASKKNVGGIILDATPTPSPTPSPSK
jgi:tetratricopeptide (TPR) repeat protein